MNQMRVRTVFAKTEAMRYTGHLDLFRALERTFRRANLPLAYSQGFNPRPKINLAAALALGITSRGETADFWLEKSMPIEDIHNQLLASAPPGIQFLSFKEIIENEPKLQNRVTESVYQASLLETEADLEQKVADALETSELPRERIVKKKLRKYDLRPLIIDLRVLPDDQSGNQIMLMHLKAAQGATGRPDEVLKQLEIDPSSVRVERVELILE